MPTAAFDFAVTAANDANASSATEPLLMPTKRRRKVSVVLNDVAVALINTVIVRALR